MRSIPCLTLLAVLVHLSGCSIVPPDVNRGELVASAGVRQIFEDGELDAIEAGERVRCERQRRVGTHRVTRLCMTIAEWEDHDRRLQETLRQREMLNRCVPTGGASNDAGSCGSGRGGL